MTNNRLNSSPIPKEKPLPNNMNNTNDPNAILNRSSHHARNIPFDYDHVLNKSDEYTVDENYT